MYIVSILQGLEMGWSGWTSVGRRVDFGVKLTKSEGRTYLFVIEKYVRGVKQDQQTRSGSAGIDDEAIWSSERRVTVDFVEIESM